MKNTKTTNKVNNKNTVKKNHPTGDVYSDIPTFFTKEQADILLSIACAIDSLAEEVYSKKGGKK